MEKKYAGFWWRFIAYLLDTVIINTVLSIFIIPIMALLGFTAFKASSYNFSEADALGMVGVVTGFVLLFIMLALVAGWLYFALMESSKYQGTIGKIAIGLIVTDMDGNKISFARATGRYFGKFISGIILDIGYFMAGFTEKKQALHDMLASTLVWKK
ncbi:MAG TPA: RDD family protein [Tenuifilaceae bacterium]|nr:RDD family protein [Tenuifilaceae bacterium]